LVIGLVLVVAGLSAYLVMSRPIPTDFTDPDGIFSARFPNRPEGVAVSQAKPLLLLWGQQLYRANVWWRQEYSVAIFDGVNEGDELYGPASRDKHINAVAVITVANANGKQLFERPATHEGHPARDVVFFSRDNGKLTALRVLAGERYVLRLAVTGPGDKDEPAAFLDGAGEFFDGVHVEAGFGPPIVDDPPAVSAVDLAAAYQADTRAADAKYKDRWLRVTGSVREVAKDGTEFLVEAGESVVVVKRAPPARMNVPVGKPGTEVAATAKCRGLEAGSAAEPRVLMEDAIVARPPPPKGVRNAPANDGFQQGDRLATATVGKSPGRSLCCNALFGLGRLVLPFAALLPAASPARALNSPPPKTPRCRRSPGSLPSP
jgi:hypothetical protein